MIAMTFPEPFDRARSHYIIATVENGAGLHLNAERKFGATCSITDPMF
jgi:hypothetical protein